MKLEGGRVTPKPSSHTESTESPAIREKSDLAILPPCVDMLGEKRIQFIGIHEKIRGRAKKEVLRKISSR